MQKKGKWNETGMLMKRLSRQQPGYSHLTHETLQENSKVGVGRGGKIERGEGTVIYAAMMECTAKTCIKAIPSEDTELHGKSSPQLV